MLSNGSKSNSEDTELTSKCSDYKLPIIELRKHQGLTVICLHILKVVLILYSTLNLLFTNEDEKLPI